MNNPELKDLVEVQKARIEELEAKVVALESAKKPAGKRVQNRVYELTDLDPATVKLPKQAGICMGLIAAQEDRSEANLVEVFKGHAETLATKQDPWRIFQYYRPMLIASNLLRVVEGPAA